MKPFQRDFLDFLLETKALRFGEFKTKSGRLSPYFINTGSFSSGEAMSRLAGFYAELIHEKYPNVTCLFGPAYKGIPLAVAISMELHRRFGKKIDYAFNRKEAKDHGDGGLIVGKSLDSNDRVVIVDDVITAGLSVEEAIGILQKQGNPKVVGIAISVNRLEKNNEGRDAVREISEKTGIPVAAALTIDEILKGVEGRGIVDAALQEKIAAYRKAYGV